MEMSDQWLVDVPVATVWTSYDSARDIDKKAISNPAEIDEWLEGLTYDTRLGLHDQNLVQTQVLFGQEVLVTNEKDGWVEVIIPDQPSSKDNRGYPGWIPKAQLQRKHDWKINQGPIAVVTAKKATLFSESEKPMMELSYQTVLPVVQELDHWVKVETPSGFGLISAEKVHIYQSQDEIPKGNGRDIVFAGEAFLGLPYLWGGMSSFGYDCSGFSYTMCKANGYTIPRDASDQAQAGKPVELEKIEPGDLLFFAYEEGKGRIHHVGIYYGNGKMLHSPKTGKSVEIIPLQGTIYEKELCTARRYWQDTEE
ncbi:C40 family peptidase [Bacillus methanolicus]|uniref:Gamma-D-glutamyl-L-lysine endopeptidase n=1 Tax=Bacillus methanolicus (strain MGA3 / ATCC 53907) TaxID=796606 RepID=I3E8S5_BACMM|nr:C40 family peptidase [Bacillus methanolicus]AIE60161.1 Gamma-D-glutamyl-L-lysine endopeptidase [Bacillus methanolicus MGA3]EIJ82896.1 cell wall endopeptidase [Bacillus methanolicus MGA3]